MSIYEPNVWHIIPINDLRDHEESEDCWCNPVLNDEEGVSVYVHNALDQRDQYETGERLLN